jgi:hypothetical protein
VTQVPLWFLILQPTALAVAALIAAFIALRQWLTARDKLRLDLFDRRLDIYRRARDFMAVITQKGRPEIGDFFPLNEARAMAPFLFGDDATEFLTKLSKIGADLAAAADSLETAQGQERSELVQSRRKSRDAFHETYEEIDRVFGRYLDFRHVRRAKTRR